MGDSHFQFRGPLCVVENQATQTGCLVQRVYITKITYLCIVSLDDCFLNDYWKIIYDYALAIIKSS